MSVQWSVNVSRERVIERIKYINSLLKTKNYHKIEKQSYENSHNVKEFVDNTFFIDDVDLENFTNDMLKEIINKPFYRMSMFENYYISEDE